MSAGKGTRPAIRGGSYAGKPYLTYAEHDRICRDVLAAEPPIRTRSSKVYREYLADALLDRRRTGAA